MNPKQLYPAHLSVLGLRTRGYCGSRNPIRLVEDIKLVTCKRCLKSIAADKRVGMWASHR